jgi:hypothetical protein
MTNFRKEFQIGRNLITVRRSKHKDQSAAQRTFFPAKAQALRGDGREHIQRADWSNFNTGWEESVMEESFGKIGGSGGRPPVKIVSQRDPGEMPEPSEQEDPFRIPPAGEPAEPSLEIAC